MKIGRERHFKVKDTRQNEVRYDLSSLTDVKSMNQAVRKQGDGENKSQDEADMTFQEDYCKIRTKEVPHHFAIHAKSYLNVLKK